MPMFIYFFSNWGILLSIFYFILHSLVLVFCFVYRHFSLTQFKYSLYCQPFAVCRFLIALQVDTDRHLEWLKGVKESHGSVAVTSLMQAEAINSRAIFHVGHLQGLHWCAYYDFFAWVCPALLFTQCCKRTRHSVNPGILPLIIHFSR